MIVYQMIKEEIEFILGEDNKQYVDEWIHFDNTIYYNNKDEPAGIIGCISNNGITYIAITTRYICNNTFDKMPMKMRRDLYMLTSNVKNIAIPFLKFSSGSKDIIRILNKRNGILSEYDNTHYIWYSKE